MKRYLQCTEYQVSLTKLTKYCACHEKWSSWLILDTNETLFTMRGATCIIVQTHQILRLPRKMTVQNLKEICWKQMKLISNARPIRAWSENDPSMKPSVRNPPRNRGYFSRPPRACCIEKYNISRSGYHSKFHRILRLPRKVTLALHQILRLPRKVSLIINPLHTWNVIYNARSIKRHCPNSPNTAPATKNEAHDWSLTQMKCYLQCAEHMRHSPNSPNTAPATKNDRPKSQRNLLKTDETSFPMRGRSEHDPRMVREWSEHETVRPQPASQPRLLFTPTTSTCTSPNTAPATKSDTCTSANTAPATKSDTWTSPNTAPATKSDTWTSPNTAPATKSDTWTSPNTAPATKSNTHH